MDHAEMVADKGYLISRIVAVKDLGYGKTENIWKEYSLLWKAWYIYV